MTTVYWWAVSKADQMATSTVAPLVDRWVYLKVAGSVGSWVVLWVVRLVMGPVAQMVVMLAVSLVAGLAVMKARMWAFGTEQRLVLQLDLLLD